MNIPANGFYVHYKHDQSGSAYNYMYEVVGIVRNTEDKTYAVIYRPLCENNWLAPAIFQARPLDMFNESIEKDGLVMPRFRLITDPALIAELEKVRDRMYQ